MGSLFDGDREGHKGREWETFQTCIRQQCRHIQPQKKCIRRSTVYVFALLKCVFELDFGLVRCLSKVCATTARRPVLEASAPKKHTNNNNNTNQM